MNLEFGHALRFEECGRLRDVWLRVEGGFLRASETRMGLGCAAAGPPRLLLPSLVDAHVHLREPGQRRKEGVARGTRAALAGGVTALLDMPNNVPPCSTEARLRAKKSLFERQSLVDWGLHLHAKARTPQAGLPVASTKIYMARASVLPAVLEVDELRRVLTQARRVTIHAEDETLFREAATHAEARPREAVVSALARIETALDGIPAATRPRVVLCHVATQEEAEWLRRMKRAGLDLWGETCPHYLFLTDEDARLRGACLQVNPPLREKRDREALRTALGDGTLDFVSSDHAPHLAGEKAGDRPPSGIAGLEWTLPLLLRLVDEGVLSLTRLVDVTHRAAARCFGFEEALHAEDLVLVERSAPPPARPCVTRAGFDPYASLGLEWRVIATFRRGRLAFLGTDPRKPLFFSHPTRDLAP